MSDYAKMTFTDCMFSNGGDEHTHFSDGWAVTHEHPYDHSKIGAHVHGTTDESSTEGRAPWWIKFVRLWRSPRPDKPTDLKSGDQSCAR